MLFRSDQALADFCAKHTCAELEEIFNKVGIPNQRAYEPGDIENDPQYAERENLVEWEDQIFGEMKGIGITNRFKNNPSQIVASAPCFGEHNREVLQEFGYTDKEIDDLYKKGEIVTWTPADTARIRHLPDWGFFWDTERQCERADERRLYPVPLLEHHASGTQTRGDRRKQYHTRTDGHHHG